MFSPVALLCIASLCSYMVTPDTRPYHSIKSVASIRSHPSISFYAMRSSTQHLYFSTLTIQSFSPQGKASVHLCHKYTWLMLFQHLSPVEYTFSPAVLFLPQICLPSIGTACLNQLEIPKILATPVYSSNLRSKSYNQHSFSFGTKKEMYS